MDTHFSRSKFLFFFFSLFFGISLATAVTNEAPMNIEKVTAILGSNSVRLNWETPITWANYPITDYIIQYKQLTALKYTTANDGKWSQTGYLLQNLNPNTTYYIRIIAVNSKGMSWYKIFRFTTKKTPTAGVCGSANSKVLTSFPSTSLLCKSWTPNILDKIGTDGDFNWECRGINSTVSATCLAQATKPSSSTTATTIPKLLLAQPWEYRTQPGKKVSIQLYWELLKNRDRDYLQFMHLDNGQTSYSVDDHDFLFISSNSSLSDLRTITVPQGIAEGTYDILVGLSWLDSSSNWVNFPLNVWQWVVNKGDNRYKVGTLFVSLQSSWTVSPPTTQTYSYQWSLGAWGSCSLSCGWGTQKRTVSCIRNDGQGVSDAFCTTVKPVISQSCNTQTCPPVQPTTPSLPTNPSPSALTTVNLSSPQTYNGIAWTEKTINLNWVRTPLGSNYLQFMHLDNGTYSFSVDDHSVNSASWSGSAVDTRTIFIPSSIPAGRYDILVWLSWGNPWQNILLYPGANVVNVWENRYKVWTINITWASTPVPTPWTTTYSWSLGAWSSCSLSCGWWSQTRTVTCISSTGQTVADTNCTGSKPAVSQSCNTQACSTSPWISSTVYGPRSSNLTSVVGPIYPKAWETISWMRISNPSGPCIVITQPNVTIKDNEIGPCMHSPDSMNTPWWASPNGFGVQIQGGSNIVIEFNKFDNVTNAVYASDGASHPIIIRHNTATNIRWPMPRWQFVQFNTVSQGSGQSRIYCNISDVQWSSVEGVEDHINMYSSYGSVLPIEIAYNRIRWWHSTTGSAIMTGDSSAAWAGGGIYVHDNTVVEVANTGIGVAGGENIRIENNRVYMTGKYGPTRIGMYAYAYVPVGWVAPLCRNNSFVGNRVWAINTIDGTGQNNFWHDTSTCSNIVDSGNTWWDQTLNEWIFNEIPQYCVDSAKGL